MGGKELMLFLLLGVANAFQSVHIEMSGEWIPELGWVVTCKWKLLAGDQLLSVRLCDNDMQFMVYRPERHGSSTSDFFRASENLMRVDCNKTRADTGQCVLNIEPYKPPSRNYVYTCEVSGERPLFRMSTEKYTVKSFVPPEVARLNVSVQREQSPVRVRLNCTTAGLPAPSLIWSVEHQKVPEDFSGRTWNPATKLWHVWSTLSPNLQPGQALPVTCTPEVTYEGELTKGTTAEYVLEDSGAGVLDPTRILILAVTIFSILR